MATDIFKHLSVAKVPEDIFGTINSGDDIDIKFTQFAKLCHPDKHKTKDKPKAEEAFKLLQEWRNRAEKKFSDGTYGQRDALDKEVTIKSRTNCYTVSRVVATGDLCDIYLATNEKSEKVVLKIPRSPKNSDLVQNEAEMLRWMREESPTKDLDVRFHTSRLRETFDLKEGPAKKRVNVFTYKKDYVTLKEVLKAYPKGVSLRAAVWMFNRILGGLSAAYRAGIVHGAVVPSNILICPRTHDGVLIDWCYSVKAGQVIKAVIPEYKSYYPSEVFTKEKASHGIDIFMAANCFSSLLGKAKLHKPIENLIRACRLGRAYRISDPFELYDELKAIMGPSKFEEFEMP